MKNIELRKITAHGVVIFSFCTLILCLVITAMIYVITAYVPDLTKWEDDLKTRKGDDRT